MNLYFLIELHRSPYQLFIAYSVEENCLLDVPLNLFEQPLLVRPSVKTYSLGSLVKRYPS